MNEAKCRTKKGEKNTRVNFTVTSARTLFRKIGYRSCRAAKCNNRNEKQPDPPSTTSFRSFFPRRGPDPPPPPLLDRPTRENTSGTQDWVIAVRRCTRFVTINFVFFMIILLCRRRFQFARIYITSLFNGCSASLTCNFRFLFTSVDRWRAVP